jgi:hypothetical protein
MIGKLIFISILFLFSFCRTKSEDEKSVVKTPGGSADSIARIAIDSSKIDASTLQLNFTEGKNYNSEKALAISTKNKVKTSPDSLRKSALENLILNQLVPYWYKTPWDFNGYTEIPKKGVVACGYFVSTVMKHAGFNLNRYKLAQQNPLNEAKSLACGDSVNVYSVGSRQLQKIFNESYTEGLYFVGLDFHVGFLLFRNKELYFIHSNYINSEGVIFEKAVYSEAFNASTNYRIAEISTNESLMEKWIDGSELTIVTRK